VSRHWYIPYFLGTDNTDNTDKRDNPCNPCLKIFKQKQIGILTTVFPILLRRNKMAKEISLEMEAFIHEHAEDNVQSLALQAVRFPHINMKMAVTQIAARQTARIKLPTWWSIQDIHYPQQLPMEQCSSEVTARYKAALIPDIFKEGCMTDLSGGFGIDFCCIGKKFAQATYVERQESLCHLAEHNFPLLQLPHAHIVHADSVEYLQSISKQQLLFIDPARRDAQGHKTIAISDCDPDITRIAPLLLSKAEWVMIKFSPMLDLSQAIKQLPHIKEIHVVAVNGECKELLLILTGMYNAEPKITCINLPATLEKAWPSPFIFTIEEEEESCKCSYSNQLEKYLYEPHAAILKAGAFRTIAQRYYLKKLHPNSHLYTSDQLIEDFPGRSFETVEQGGFNKQEIKNLLSHIKKANLTIRNFPASVAELRKKLKLAEGGDDYLFATTLGNGEKQWILCRKILKNKQNN